MSRLCTRRPDLEVGIRNMPDYGSGWNPMQMALNGRMEAWYAAWNSMGAQSGGVLQATNARDMSYDCDLGATLGSNAPALGTVAGVLNGRLCWDITTSTRLRSAESSKSPTGTSKTGFVVFNAKTSVNMWLFSKSTSDTVEEYVLSVLNTPSKLLYWDSGDNTNSYVQSANTWATGTNYILTGRTTTTGNAHVVRLNGTQIGSSTGTGAVSDSSADVFIGQGLNGSATSNAYIAECLIYRESLSDAECLTIERKLGAYYGCAVA